ncbi:MAG: ATP-binding cassette domain-containing protein [Cyclobacteriaceae bacterium]
MLSISELAYNYLGLLNLSYRDIQLKQNEKLLILGGSGSGKTTLLHLIGGLMELQKGSISLNGTSYRDLSGSQMDKFRANHIGLVFQKPHLLSSLNVLENLMLSQVFSGGEQSKDRAIHLLESVGLVDKITAKIDQLSQGQAQRVALLRAVINQPDLILADEPTSSLDDKNAESVMDLLISQADENNAILLVTTHDQRVKERISNHYLL